jgi:hypothetical protein
MDDYYASYGTYAWDFNFETHLNQFGRPDDEWDFSLKTDFDYSTPQSSIHDYPNKPNSKLISYSMVINGMSIKGFMLDVSRNKLNVTKNWLESNNCSYHELSIDESRCRYFLYDISPKVLDLLKKRFYKIFEFYDKNGWVVF